MKKSFLEYYKEILDKVSFDASLFRKELEKAFTALSEFEILKLKEWVNYKYPDLGAMIWVD